MRLLLCLAATAALCQAARIPRGIDPFPNFHSVHHGYGATSYQNFQIENHGSVPVPAGDHDHDFERQDHVVVHHKEPHYALHDEHHNVASLEISSEDNHQDLQQYIIVKEDHPDVSSLSAATVTGSHEIIQPYISYEPGKCPRSLNLIICENAADHHEVSSAKDIHENVQYVTLKQVPYEIRHFESPTSHHLNYYDNNYEHEYH